ncbi:MAG TPA: hypothetical protein VG817_03400 [Gemmatimonadales bacterium]|nr:hypothetical protein [Gemmatimonadales bacterium]
MNGCWCSTLVDAEDWSVVQRYDALPSNPDSYEQPYVGSSGSDSFTNLVDQGRPDLAMDQTAICAVP